MFIEWRFITTCKVIYKLRRICLMSPRRHETRNYVRNYEVRNSEFQFSHLLYQWYTLTCLAKVPQVQTSTESKFVIPNQLYKGFQEMSRRCSRSCPNVVLARHSYHARAPSMRPERGAISQWLLGVFELTSFQLALFVCVFLSHLWDRHCR
jgi:hypothetical protein